MNYDFPHSIVGENCNEYIKRNAIVFNEIKNKFKDSDDILIIGHTATAYALLSFAENKLSGEIKWIKIGNSNYLIIEM